MFLKFKKKLNMSFFQNNLEFLEKVRIKEPFIAIRFFLFFSFLQFFDIKNYNFFSKMSQIHTKKNKIQIFPQIFFLNGGNLFFSDFYIKKH
jgi:hypothetical protein